jgi:hypothetical protein
MSYVLYLIDSVFSARIFMKRVLMSLCWLLLSQLATAETLIHPKVFDAKEELPLAVLTLALSKSAPTIIFEPHELSMTAERSTQALNSGRLSVFWSGVTPEHERDLLPIRIPILKGILGHRIFIIEKEKEHLFSQVSSLDDLKQFRAGQGTKWGDTLILKGAGLPTVTTLKYHNLFPMLEGDRFDYFPRAIHEPWTEVAARPELNLTVEKRLLLVYPFAMYFYVKKDNQALHDLINEGFEQAIADGSFDKLFYDNQLVKDVLEKAKLEDRTVIRIDNPMMGPKTPWERQEFWHKLEEI